MAVGKGSMERAAKASSAKKKAGGTAKAKSDKPVAAAEVLAAPDEAVLQQIIYQSSSGMLSRDAEPNERFGLGDDMPVYYF